MKVALVQLNPIVGDVRGNTRRILAALDAARRDQPDLAVFPEQAFIGYPGKDLLLRREVIRENTAALQDVTRASAGLNVIIGCAEPNDDSTGRMIYNSAAVLCDGRVAGFVRKRLLPTYDIFDEVRYFQPGGSPQLFTFAGRRVGVSVCEDIWTTQTGAQDRPLYDCDPVADLARLGAELIVNISASPFTLDKHGERMALLSMHARAHRLPVVYVNQVGGNDELLFDGASCVVDAGGQLIAAARAFDDDTLVVDLDQPHAARREPFPTGVAGLHQALVVGLRDYVRKCGFRSVVVGLSGGIDSAVVACLAADALGPASVYAVAMPSRFSSSHSVSDAQLLAANLGIRFQIIPIESIHSAFEACLTPVFGPAAAGVAEENVQARARGTLLMALSNKAGHLLLTTGNKSELAVGYCTLYGDMCGGLAVISDVPKTKVYELANYINQRHGGPRIPEGTLTKPPSAELRPDQTDQDTLPPYDVLDAILERYEERLDSVERIIADGFDPAIVHDVVRRITASEYKRQQAAPGLKVTSRAFGFGRRMPIAARSLP
ncbi:MAG: Glutamine-dependent NAD(+) synthetase [Phycisphaerae bacterium]|nr:Glutamine-dependent NAD(+) synthetase [Phycisphaerae bacterium]